MDESESLGTQTLSHSPKIQFLKKVTHLVLSVSLLSVLFPRSWYWLSCLHSLSLQLITHTIDKNCIFILCNGLLVLVVKNSGFKSSSKSVSGDDDDSQMKPLRSEKGGPLIGRWEMKAEGQEEIGMVGDGLMGVEGVEDEAQKQAKMLMGEDEEASERKEVVGRGHVEENEEKHAEGESLDETVMTEEEEEEDYHDEEDDNDEVVAVAEEEEDDDEGSYYDGRIGEENNTLTTEEINKKFDEFIRRMKEELRFEARQHLVMVQEA